MRDRTIPGFPPAFIAAVRSHHAGMVAADDVLLRDANLRVLTGGRNNGAYAFQQEGRTYCLKCYKVDGRQRVETEWRTLNALAECGYTPAPLPLAYDPDARVPIVIMEFVSGEGLGGRLNPVQLAALEAATQSLHAITPSTLRHPLRHAEGDAPSILRRVREGEQTIAAYLPDAECHVAARLWRAWLRGPDPALLLESADAVFSRSDPNLANCLWDGERLRMIDFEYAGWSDRAVDLADLVEHPASFATPEDTWAEFVARFDLSAMEERRYVAARRMFALFFLMRFWPQEGGHSDDRFSAQYAHVATLLKPLRG